MPTAHDIAEYLEDQGIGTVGTDIFVNFTPADIDNCVTVSETPGQAPETAVDIDRPGLQIKVRNTAQETAETNIDAIYGILNKLANTTIETRFYYWISAVGSKLPLGQDDQRRFTFTQNYEIMKDRESSGP